MAWALWCEGRQEHRQSIQTLKHKKRPGFCPIELQPPHTGYNHTGAQKGPFLNCVCSGWKEFIYIHFISLNTVSAMKKVLGSIPRAAWVLPVWSCVCLYELPPVSSYITSVINTYFFNSPVVRSNATQSNSLAQRQRASSFRA